MYAHTYTVFAVLQILTQQLNLSLRVRLKDELVQWQLKRSPDTEPVTFGLRCSTLENAQKVRCVSVCLSVCIPKLSR